MKKGLLIVISAPAGCGKDTIIEKVLENNPAVRYSVSATTRKIREGETDGTHYFFKTREEFEELIEQDGFLEYTEYVGNYYGTPKTAVERALKNGTDIILKIEVEGANNIKRMFPESVCVFILPPSFEELRRRLHKRGTEDKRTIERRIKTAKAEILRAIDYDYNVVNDDLKKAVSDIEAIIRAERLRTKRAVKSS